MTSTETSYRAAEIREFQASMWFGLGEDITDIVPVGTVTDR